MPMPTPDAPQWWSMLREIGALQLIHVDLTPHACVEASAFSWLDESERARWRRFVYPGPRRRFALCRAALRSILCAQLGCVNPQLSFGYACHGKPFALIGNDRAPVSFNVSHSDKRGLIVYASQGQLGVDVEEYTPRRDMELLIGTVFGPNEQADLALTHGRSKIRLFYKLWTIKEALIKAAGSGFSCDVARFEVPPALRHGMTGAFVFPQRPTKAWQVEYIGNDEFAGSVAYEISSDAGGIDG